MNRLYQRLIVQSRTLALIANASGAVMLEFAIVANVFLILLLGVFELSFDMFTQAVLDGALQTAARQLQTGNAQNVTNGAAFLTNYMCPDLNGLLGCSGVYISVQKLDPTSGQDLYDYTTGGLPLTGSGALNLSAYTSQSFCNTGPSELILISAIYVGPSLVGSFVPGFSETYNGQRVHATLSTVSLVTEGYPLQASGAATVAASC